MRSMSALAIERIPRPRAGEVAPFGQLPRGASKPIDRTVVAAERRAPQAPAGHLRADPPAAPGATRPNASSNSRADCRLGEDVEERIDAGLDRPLAQQVGAEAMDGADVGFFELRERGVERRLACSSLRLGRALALEPLAQPQLQLARRFLGERDRDNLVRPSARPSRGSARSGHELGRLAGAGSGFDDERVVERVGDRWRAVVDAPAASESS